MSDDDASNLVDLDQLERYLWWGAALFWAIFFISLIGELRGWWNFVGEVGTTIGGIIGGLLTVVALIMNATKGQVRAVRTGVTDNGRRLGMIHDGVRTLHHDNEQLDGGIRQLHEDNERQTEVLEEIRDRL